MSALVCLGDKVIIAFIAPKAAATVRLRGGKGGNKVVRVKGDLHRSGYSNNKTVEQQGCRDRCI